jgi:hypothetical protein
VRLEEEHERIGEPLTVVRDDDAERTRDPNVWNENQQPARGIGGDKHQFPSPVERGVEPQQDEQKRTDACDGQCLGRDREEEDQTRPKRALPASVAKVRDRDQQG